ncbi:helix-turn-helix transcriptional regulator [Aidingimonas halophila]|nr:LuxR C-terminal-related transcriptional regulator [Aidingimonas halophila]
MSSLETLAWHRGFGQAVDKLDSPSFWLGVVRLLRTSLTFHTWMAVVFSRTQPPVLLGVSGEEEGSDERLLQDYRHGLYLLDPFYIAIGEGERDGLYRLDDVAPDCFTDTEYYRRYFQRNVVSDEVQFNVSLDADRTLCLSLGSQARYNADAIGFMALVQPWLLPLMRQRMHFESDIDQAEVQRTYTTISRRPFPLDDDTLTEREREVSQLMLSGCSTKGIARRLDISIETVRSHKKHLYHKLGVSTQSELFALFWTRQGKGETWGV